MTVGTVSVQDSHVAALLRMTMRLSRWQFAVHDDSLLLMVKVWHSVLHVIRSAIPVMLSGAKHLSHHSALSLISSFRPTVISTERFPLSFLLLCSSDYVDCDRANRVEKSVCYAWHRRRNIRPPTTTAQALRGARPQRALLAPGCCLLATY